MKRKNYTVIIMGTAAAMVALSIYLLWPESKPTKNVFWSDSEICRAAVKTYFFLNAQPTNAAGGGTWHGFRSTAGNYYICRVDGKSAVISWINKSGEEMNSRTTTFYLSGSRLSVMTDMSEETFFAVQP